MRAGVNRGPVFTADIGPPERRVWSLMGDAVNLAARVMVKAEPGALLATPAALERARDEFERTPDRAVQGKGQVGSGPRRKGRLGTRAPVSPTAQAGAPMVGRDRELAELREALDAARAGERSVIELVGEPGLGKSTLVRAAREHAADMNQITVEGGPYAARTPYLAMRRGLRAIVLPELDDASDLAGPLAERVERSRSTARALAAR